MAVKDIAVKKRPWLLLPDGAKKSGVSDGDRNCQNYAGSQFLPQRFRRLMALATDRN